MKRLAHIAAIAAVFMIAMPGQVHACDSTHPENFTTFFTRFSGDKAFALSRTIYPSTRTHYEYRMEDGKQQITERQRKVAKRDDANYPPLGEYIKSIGLESKAQVLSADEAIVEIFKPHTSGLLTYHFSLTRGCWFLREIQNHSL
jgi:hypothetical protein